MVEKPASANRLGERLAALVRSPFFAPGCLVALFIAVFHKPLLLGKCISRIGESALKDGAFRADTLPPPLFPDFDPCLYLWYMPVRDFLKGSIMQGKLPFWNPYRSFGYPEFSHPSQSFFNPVLLPSPVSQEYLYCAMLILQTLLGALGTWFVCRKLRLNQWASFWAATAFGLSCRMLGGLELALFDCMVPFIFLSILHLIEVFRLGGTGDKARPVATLPKVLLVTCLWAYGFLSMHLEVYVISLFATLACFGADVPLSKWLGKRKDQPGIIRYLLLVAGAGILALTVVAPVLVPMLKHLGACDFYKAGMAAGVDAKFPEFLKDALGWKGCDAAPLRSIFAGTATFLLLPVAFVLRWRPEVRVMGGLVFLTMMWAYPTVWLADLISHPPFSWLAPQYFLPIGVMSVAVLSACGLNALTRLEGRHQRTFGTILVVLGPVIAVAVCALFGATVSLKTSSLLIPGISIVLFIACIWSSGRFRAVILTALIGINVATLVNVDRKIVRTQPHIAQALQLPETLRPLMNTSDRVVVCGINYLLPNISTLFRINEINIADPMAPRGYNDFLQLLGATKLDGFHLNFSRFPAKVIKLSGARYLTARGPIVPEDYFEKCAATGGTEQLGERGLLAGLRATGGWLQIDRPNKQLFGRIDLRIHPLLCSYASPRFSVALLDSSGRVLDTMPADWSGEMPQQRPAASTLTFALALPDDCVSPKLAIKVDNQWTGTCLASGSKNHSIGGDWSVVCDAVKTEQADTTPQAKSWLTLKSAAASGGHRLYEILEPVPPMYFVSNGCFADRKGASEILASDVFDPHQSCVLETGEDTEAVPPSVAPGELMTDIAHKCEWKAISNRDFEARVECSSPGYVVLNQAFFPGWSAKIDGVPAKIFRANAMFQAVAVPAGSHTVGFSFVPSGLAPGLSVFGGGALFMLALLVRDRRRRKSLPMGGSTSSSPKEVLVGGSYYDRHN